MRPGNYKCNSSNVNYLINSKKCDSGNYIGEASAIFRFHMNNHTKNIWDNNKGLPVARHFNETDHSISDLECVILKGDFSNGTLQIDRRTKSHPQIENRHSRPKPRHRLSYTSHLLPQVKHLSLYPHSLDV